MHVSVTSVCCAFRMVKRAACGAVMPCAIPLCLRGIFAGRKANGTHAVRVGLQQNASVVHALPAALHAVNPHLRAGKRLFGGVPVRVSLRTETVNCASP